MSLWGRAKYFTMVLACLLYAHATRTWHNGEATNGNGYIRQWWKEDNTSRCAGVTFSAAVGLMTRGDRRWYT